MKHQEAMKLIPQIEEALATNREIAYFHSCGQHLFTVKAIYGKFLDVAPVDKSTNFSVTLTSPDIKRDCFAFEAIPAGTKLTELK